MSDNDYTDGHDAGLDEGYRAALAAAAAAIRASPACRLKVLSGSADGKTVERDYREEMAKLVEGVGA